MKLSFLFDKLKIQEYIKDMNKVLTTEQAVDLSYRVVQAGAGNPDRLETAHTVEGENKPVTLPKPDQSASEHLLEAISGPAHAIVRLLNPS